MGQGLGAIPCDPILAVSVPRKEDDHVEMIGNAETILPLMGPICWFDLHPYIAAENVGRRVPAQGSDG